MVRCRTLWQGPGRRHSEKITAQEASHRQTLRIVATFSLRLPKRVRQLEQRFDEVCVDATREVPAGGEELLPFDDPVFRKLGHRDLGTTQRYMHLSPAAMESAIRLLEQPRTMPVRGDTVETAGADVGNVNG